MFNSCDSVSSIANTYLTSLLTKLQNTTVSCFTRNSAIADKTRDRRICVREQKPRFLYLCGTTNQHFTTTNFIVRDEATFQAAIIAIYCECHVNIHCHVILRKPREASFHAKKKTNFFIHAKSPDQATTHASTTQCLVSLSHSVIYV